LSGYNMCTPFCRILSANHFCINFDGMTNFCCGHISCIRKPNYCLDLMLRPHVHCKVMSLNTVLSLENSQLLCNKSSQSKTSWNDIMCLVNSFLDYPTCSATVHVLNMKFIHPKCW
jgi:hypothetical protein